MANYTHVGLSLVYNGVLNHEFDTNFQYVSVGKALHKEIGVCVRFILQGAMSLVTTVIQQGSST